MDHNATWQPLVRDVLARWVDGVAMGVKVKGLQKVFTGLKQLQAKIHNDLATKGLREGANVVRRHARATVPVETGRLQRSIRVYRKKTGHPMIAACSATSRQPYAIKIERQYLFMAEARVSAETETVYAVEDFIDANIKRNWF